MRPRMLGALAVAALGLSAAAWWAMDARESGQAKAAGVLLPGFEARVEQVDAIEVAGAGGGVLVRLEKHEGQWRMPAKLDWPGNQREISRALFRLAAAKRIEAKTADPARHARLGVEAVASAEAKGVELRVYGGGEPVRLVVGDNHPGLGGSYVRLGDDPQAWLLDEDVAPARNPVDWLDRRLLDIPLARVESVRVAPAQGRAFTLSRVEGGFSLDGLPVAAMGNPDDGNATAGFPDQLAFDDLAADDGTDATLVATFTSVDGLSVTVSAWRRELQTWARLSVALDEVAARDWYAAEARREAEAARAAAEAAEAAADGTGDDGDDSAGADAPPATDAPVDAAATAAFVEERLAGLREQARRLRVAFDGKQFLVPPYKAANLLKTREEYLAGTP